MNNEILNTIVSNLENILKIDAADIRLPFNNIMDNVCFRISKNYSMSVDKEHFDFNSDNVVVNFRTAIEVGNQSLAIFYANMTIFETGDLPTLADVKYVGFPMNSMMNLFAHLSKDIYVKSVAQNIKDIEDHLNVIIEANTTKRLLIILCVAYELKIWYMVNLIASILYLADRKVNQNV